MEVLIVSKTRMTTNNHVCIGAVGIHDLQSVRMLEFGRQNPTSDTPYTIGDIWDVEYTYCQSVEPPHVEDAIVRQRKLISQNNDANEIIGSRISIWRGSPDVLFEGTLFFTHLGKGYVSKKGKVPNKSTGFWISDQPLQLQTYNDKPQYFYRGFPDDRRLPFVGIEHPVNDIPQGTLLRVSLARWWRPIEKPDEEERCYLQLSGWYKNIHATETKDKAAKVIVVENKQIANSAYYEPVSPTWLRPPTQPENPPSGFGKYECLECGERLFGIDWKSHVNQKHNGERVKWEKIW